MEKKMIYLAIVLFLIGFGIGRQSGIISERRISEGKLSQSQTEIRWWKSVLENFFPPLPEEIYSLSGKVLNTEGKTILMEAYIQVSQFPLPGGKEIEKKNIKVNTTDQTKISQIEMIEPPPEPPAEPFIETILSFRDIKIGDDISVASTENIKGKTEILADQIQLITPSF